MSTPSLLLDTCVIIFAHQGVALREEANHLLGRASEASALFVSPMSAWEIGKLVATRKLRLPFDPLDFFNRFIATAGVSICTVSPEILVRSSMLPDFAHRDPMDCILVATARIKDYTIVTSDRKILDYGRRGHVKTLSC